MNRLLALTVLLLLGSASCTSTQHTPTSVGALAEGKDSNEALYYQNGFTRYRIERIGNSSDSVVKMFYRGGEPLYYLEVTDGNPHGEYRQWYANGHLMERGRYVDGTPEGVWETFDSNGLRRGHGHLGEPVLVAGSFSFSDPQSPLSLGLPTMAFFEKSADWSGD